MDTSNRVRVRDSVCKVAQDVDLAKSLNTLRTDPNAPNPFVVSQSERIANHSNPIPVVTLVEQPVVTLLEQSDSR
jgi:hypothetical protein